MSTTITTLTQLQQMENDLTEDYVLGNNIDASATTGWNSLAGFDPVGTSATPFTGSFDGADYTISDLFIDRAAENYVGLFGCVDEGASIHDVSLTDVDINGASYVGGLIGETLSTVTALATTVTDCSVSGSVTSDTGGSYVGGLVGNAVETTITDCYATATVSAVDDRAGGLIAQTNACVITTCYATGNTSGEYHCGGLVGYDDDTTTFTKCYATGDVSCETSGGGFGGRLDDSVITKCYATGDISITAAYEEGGGFAGLLDGAGTITDCYATGDVAGGTADEIGGFVGENNGFTITNAYSVGAVTGSGSDIGGLCGVNTSGTITACFWDTEISGQASSDGGTGKTTAEMKTEATFTDASWDFITIWILDADSNSSYPSLRDYGLFPTCRTLGATRIEATTARINGKVTDDDGLSCNYRFRYRQVEAGASYTNTAWTGSKETDDTFYENLTGLTEDSTYEFAAQIKNTAATSDWGSTLYFTCGTREYTIPPVYDEKGRIPKGARVQARRSDTGLVVETEYLDSSGQATFTDLPNNTGISFYISWGGSAIKSNMELLFSTIAGVSEGGTGSSTVEGARTSLGLGSDDSPQFTAIELGHASDTTIARDSAGVVSIEGKRITRGATYIVAANDSEIKTQADYVCDGTDDHIQIQAAIDALPATGGRVLLLDGTYNIESSIVLDSYQTLRGCGRNTNLTTTTADLDIITATGSSGSEKIGITLADFCIDGDAGGATNDRGIQLTYVDHSKLLNLWSIDNGETGIVLIYSDANIVSGNTCRANTREGILILGSENNIVSTNICQGNTLNGIYLTSSGNNNTISDNICEGNGEHGIWNYGSNNNIISENSVQGSGENGLLVQLSNHNTVVGNYLSENSQDADDADDNIQLYDADYNNVQGNTCRAGGETNKPRYGINIGNSGCNSNKIINNDLYDDGFGTGDFSDSGTGTIYVEPGIDDTPVNGETGQPISSNWAYDHAASGHSYMIWDAGVVSEELTYDARIAFDLGTSTQRY